MPRSGRRPTMRRTSGRLRPACATTSTTKTGYSISTVYSPPPRPPAACRDPRTRTASRSEEHTSELQSQSNLVCRLLLEKKKRQDYLKAVIFRLLSLSTGTSRTFVKSTHLTPVTMTLNILEAITNPILSDDTADGL